MLSTLDPGSPAGDKQERQIRIEVQIPVAQRAAVKDKRLIEQRAIAVRRGTQLVEVIGQHLRMEDVDLNDLRDLLAIALVMRHGMMGIAKSQFRIGTAAHLVADLERADARHVGLPSEHQQIRHQLIVIREDWRDADRDSRLR